MYRLEGWKNPYSILPEHMEQEYPILPEFTAFEAGADAMLEGLRKEGTKIEDGEIYNSPCQICNTGEDCQAIASGHLVFIPEEEI